MTCCVNNSQCTRRDFKLRKIKISFAFSFGFVSKDCITDYRVKIKIGLVVGLIGRGRGILSSQN